MKRLTIIAGIMLFIMLVVADYISAGIDAPHNARWTTTGTKKITCGGCHAPLATAGPSLTIDAGNFTLCYTCHQSGQPAGNLPFDVQSQADWATGSGWGHSHRWDRNIKAGQSPLWLSIANPNNIYGLRTYEELDASSVSYAIYKYGYVNICSGCHNQHYQTALPWDTSGKVDRGTASGGWQTVVIDSSKTWTTNEWVGFFYVRMLSGRSKSRIAQIKNNEPTKLTVYKTGVYTDPLAVRDGFYFPIAAGDTYVVMGKENHHLRMNNRRNELCGYCHYYRWTTLGTDVRNWDGNKKSHPLNKNLTTDVTDTGQFVGGAPLEPVWIWNTTSVLPQTGPPRYGGNGGWDTNSTNNIILDENSKVRCMSCHGIHYTYSDSTTPHVP